LIVGLGNPGAAYRDTRHNVGFAVVECLAQRHHAALRQRAVDPSDRPLSHSGDYRTGDRDVRVMMPMTMMNVSGLALAAANAEASETLIVCDDANLPLGRLRVRAGGGAGGHHGLASCLEALGTEEVARVRLGVGVEPLPRDLTDFVLGTFEAHERPIIQHAIERAVEACEAWIQEGIAAAMNRYNTTQDDAAP
jgi:PTH1 family peptidyl-tRNA hydrolase